MVEITGHIGRRLRELRTWRDLSQTTLGELAGFTGAYVSAIERGERPIERRATIEAFARALRVSPSDLAGATLEQQLADPDVSAAQATVTDIEGGTHRRRVRRRDRSATIMAGGGG